MLSRLTWSRFSFGLMMFRSFRRWLVFRDWEYWLITNEPRHVCYLQWYIHGSVRVLISSKPSKFQADAVNSPRRGLGRDIWRVSFDNITRVLYVGCLFELLCLMAPGLPDQNIALRKAPFDRLVLSAQEQLSNRITTLVRQKISCETWCCELKL